MSAVSVSLPKLEFTVQTCYCGWEWQRHGPFLTTWIWSSNRWDCETSAIKIPNPSTSATNAQGRVLDILSDYTLSAFWYTVRPLQYRNHSIKILFLEMKTIACVEIESHVELLWRNRVEGELRELFPTLVPTKTIKCLRHRYRSLD